MAREVKDDPVPERQKAIPLVKKEDVQRCFRALHSHKQALGEIQQTAARLQQRFEQHWQTGNSTSDEADQRLLEDVLQGIREIHDCLQQTGLKVDSCMTSRLDHDGFKKFQAARITEISQVPGALREVIGLLKQVETGFRGVEEWSRVRGGKGWECRLELADAYIERLVWRLGYDDDAKKEFGEIMAHCLGWPWMVTAVEKLRDFASSLILDGKSVHKYPGVEGEGTEASQRGCALLCVPRPTHPVLDNHHKQDLGGDRGQMNIICNASRREESFMLSEAQA